MAKVKSRRRRTNPKCHNRPSISVSVGAAEDLFSHVTEASPRRQTQHPEGADMNRSYTRGIALALIGIACLVLARTSHAGIESLIVPYTAIEDVVYGQKEGMGLTLDVLTPEKDGNGLGIVLISSGSWKSSKSNIAEEVAEMRKDHWAMGLLHGGFTVFIVRHGSGPRFFV
ncbi:MAG: hypothetical protein WC655_22235, partial [Candidatus Hydrogenedentales bacterium]